MSEYVSLNRIGRTLYAIPFGPHPRRSQLQKYRMIGQNGLK
jgi:hypothetical protein